MSALRYPNKGAVPINAPVQIVLDAMPQSRNYWRLPLGTIIPPFRLHIFGLVINRVERD